jgi:hypothetical protein
MDQGRAERIASRLVYGYTHHFFPIDITEARDMGLSPREMSEEEYESAIEVVTTCNDNQVCIEFVGEGPGSVQGDGASAAEIVPEAAGLQESR